MHLQQGQVQELTDFRHAREVLWRYGLCGKYAPDRVWCPSEHVGNGSEVVYTEVEIVIFSELLYIPRLTFRARSP